MSDAQKELREQIHRLMQSVAPNQDVLDHIMHLIETYAEQKVREELENINYSYDRHLLVGLQEYGIPERLLKERLAQLTRPEVADKAVGNPSNDMEGKEPKL